MIIYVVWFGVSDGTVVPRNSLKLFASNNIYDLTVHHELLGNALMQRKAQTFYVRSRWGEGFQVSSDTCTKTYASVNLTCARPPAPPPPGQLRGICPGSLSWGRGICAPRGEPPGIWYTRFQNRQNPGPSRCVLCSFAIEAFVGNDMDFTSQ